MAMRPGSLQTRTPAASDWSRLAVLANAALAHVPKAPVQDEWTRNRQAFEGEQIHFVAERAGLVVGYGAVERRPDEPIGVYRIFVVTSWAETPEVADEVYETLCGALEEVGARRVWLRELAADFALIRFAEAQGFRITQRYEYAGQDIVMLEKGLAGSGGAGAPTR